MESSVSCVARSRKFLPKNPGNPRQKAENKISRHCEIKYDLISPRPRMLTRAFSRKITAERAPNQKKMWELEKLQINLLSSQLMLVKELVMLVVSRWRRLTRLM